MRLVRFLRNQLPRRQEQNRHCEHQISVDEVLRVRKTSLARHTDVNISRASRHPSLLSSDRAGCTKSPHPDSLKIMPSSLLAFLIKAGPFPDYKKSFFIIPKNSISRKLTNPLQTLLQNSISCPKTTFWKNRVKPTVGFRFKNLSATMPS